MSDVMRYKSVIFVMLILFSQLCYGQDVNSISKEIAREVVRSSSDKAGRPLPVACAWGATDVGFAPKRLLRLLEQGHYVLPAFQLHNFKLTRRKSSEAMAGLFRDYGNLFKRMRELGLPVVLLSTQWEAGLSGKKYLSLEPPLNPNVVTSIGRVLPKVSPFGPVKAWEEIGKQWTDCRLMKMLQHWYPDPPRVIFLSNNEHAKLGWRDVEKSGRYMEKYGKGKSADFKRKVIGDGWIERYRAMQKGMREGLVNETWRKNARFVAYKAFGSYVMGRWGGWEDYSLHTKDRFAPYPLMWDGGSSSYYTHDWNPCTDYKVWSPQVQFMNLVPMKKMALEMNPDFWLEISTWDGFEDRPEREKTYSSKRSAYRKLGQVYDPDRYLGYVQYGLWLIRPRAVREYRGHTFSWKKAEPYFMSVVKAVDKVHKNPLLKDFWKRGTLVPNRAHKHPYKVSVPKNFENEDRWFLLDADANPSFPWKLDTEIKVFSLALVMGKSPGRQWLVYAHSPLKEQKGVKITIPDYKAVTITSPVAGAFYLVDEHSDAVMRVE